MKIVPWPGAASGSKRILKPGVNPIAVGVLSYDAFDATSDLDRATVTLNGTIVRSARDAKGTETPACQAKDINADKIADLVCEFELKLAASDVTSTKELTLEAQTRHGWGVHGVIAAPQN